MFIAESGWGRESWRLYPSAHSRLSGELWAMGVGPWRVPTVGPEDTPCFLSTVQDQPKDRDPSPASLCPRSQRGSRGPDSSQAYFGKLESQEI